MTEPARNVPLTAEEGVATGCGYTGYEFGGGYLDSTCIDGYLWDLDSCDDAGGGLTKGGEIPCPKCNADAETQAPTPPSNGDVEGAVERIADKLDAAALEDMALGGQRSDLADAAIEAANHLRTLLSALSAHQEREARAREALEAALSSVEYQPGDHPIVPIKHDAFVKKVAAIVQSLKEAK